MKPPRQHQNTKMSAQPTRNLAVEDRRENIHGMVRSRSTTIATPIPNLALDTVKVGTVPGLVIEEDAHDEVFIIPKSITPRKM
jgi:hypothetical protein